MALDLFKNFAKVQVSTGYDASATSIVLSSGHGAKLPTPPFNATWWNDTDYPDPSDDMSAEIVRVTAVATDTLTVTRAQESTAASVKNIAGKTYRMIAGLTAKTFNTDLGAALAQQGNGRLTLATGEPVAVVTDVTAATTIYFTPFKGNVISLYDGANWVAHAFSEVSIALGTLTSGSNYDVFIYSNAGTPTLEFSAAWASDNARTDAIAFQDGIYVKSGAPTRRYLGTFRTTSTTTTEDSETKRFLWNVDNQVFRRCYKDIPGSHSYSSAAWRFYNGDTTSKVELVIGAMTVANIGFSGGLAAGTASTSYLGVGINSTTGATGNFALGNGNPLNMQAVFSLPWPLIVGYTAVNLIEYTPSSATYQGGSVAVTYLA